MNDYEAHLSSYDHTHKQRLKDLKTMVRDPAAAARARRQEQKASEGGAVISIKLGGAGGGGGGEAAGGGFKKGGFKKTGFKSAFGPVAGAATAAAPVKESDDGGLGRGEGGGDTGLLPTAAATAAKSELVESDTEDEGYEVYDPRRPTD